MSQTMHWVRSMMSFLKLRGPTNLRCNYYNFIQQIGKVNPYSGEKFLMKNNYF